MHIYQANYHLNVLAEIIWRKLQATAKTECIEIKTSVHLISRIDEKSLKMFKLIGQVVTQGT